MPTIGGFIRILFFTCWLLFLLNDFRFIDLKEGKNDKAPEYQFGTELRGEIIDTSAEEETTNTNYDVGHLPNIGPFGHNVLILLSSMIGIIYTLIGRIVNKVYL